MATIGMTLHGLGVAACALVSHMGAGPTTARQWLRVREGAVGSRSRSRSRQRTTAPMRAHTATRPPRRYRWLSGRPRPGWRAGTGSRAGPRTCHQSGTCAWLPVHPVEDERGPRPSPRIR